MENIKITTFIEPAGRTMIGEFISENSDILTVKNPTILHVQPDANGRLNIQTFPLFFKELINTKNPEKSSIWQYPKKSIVISNVELEERLYTAYVNLWYPQTVAPVTSPRTVKLFDEEPTKQ